MESDTKPTEAYLLCWRRTRPCCWRRWRL